MENLSEKYRFEESRILLHSHRNIYNDLHYRLGLYEFEDIIRQVDTVDQISPYPLKRFNYGTRIANKLATKYGNAIISPRNRKNTN